MFNKLKERYNTLNGSSKKAVVFLGIALLVSVISVLSYFKSAQNTAKMAAASTPKGAAVNTIKTNDNFLATSTMQDAKKDAQIYKEENEELRKQLAESKKMTPEQRAAADGLVPRGSGLIPSSPPPSRPSSSASAQNLPPIPAPPRGANSLPPPPPPMQGNPAAASAPGRGMDTEIGGISQVVNTVKPDTEDKKKDEKRTIYLPVSYMEATLLSGLDAPVSSEGKGNPVPSLIRVKTPAVLPNDVKANLRGCFVIADSKGNLGTERAEMILVTLSCIDKKGRSVIDSPISGYVVDADGKAGLRGRVVTKMGAMIVRTAMAGMFSGFGEAVASANSTSTTTLLGTSQTVDAGKVGMAGLGKGASSAFKELEKFYMELARLTLPVIEIGAARPITLVVTKGVTVDIKKLKGDL